MVTRWGLSDRLGPLMYGEEEEEVFLGRSVTQHKNVSDETAHIIDEEIRNIVERDYDRARRSLKDNIEILHAMAEALIKYETIDTDQIADLMAGRTPKPPEGWDDDSSASSGGTTVTPDDAPKKSNKDDPVIDPDPAGQH